MRAWFWWRLSDVCFFLGDRLRDAVTRAHRGAYWLVRQGALSLARSTASSAPDESSAPTPEP
jgi:hypothetical protein